MKNYKRLSALLISALILMASCGAKTENSDAFDGFFTSAPEEAMKDEIAWAETEVATEAVYDKNLGASYSYSSKSEPYVSPTASTGTGTAQNDLSERKIIKNATINFETKEYTSFSSSLNTKISELGGYVERSEMYGDAGDASRSNRSAYIVAKIPAQNYDKFMSDVSELGNVTYRTENIQDATASYTDTEARIKSLETEYNALIGILEKATELKDVISLQSRISEVTYQLESYKSTLRKYDNLIAYCTVNINVQEVIRETPKVDPLSFSDRVKEGLSDAMYDIRTALSDFAVWFVVSLPYILIWGIVIAIAVLVLKIIYNKSKRKREIKRVEKALKNASVENNKNTNKDDQKNN